MGMPLRDDSVARITRRIGISRRRDRVGIADLPTSIVDDGLPTSRTAQILLGGPFRGILCAMRRVWGGFAWLFDRPIAGTGWDDVSSVAGHR